MNTTATLKTPGHALQSWMQKISVSLAYFAKLAFSPVDAHAERAESIRQLLALADSYAETQPSYAADLRAAAMSYVRAD